MKIIDFMSKINDFEKSGFTANIYTVVCIEEGADARACGSVRAVCSVQHAAAGSVQAQAIAAECGVRACCGARDATGRAR